MFFDDFIYEQMSELESIYFKRAVYCVTIIYVIKLKVNRK